MNSKLVELALKKQRLQSRSAVLRGAFADYAARWAPVFVAVDRARAGLVWLRHHPILPVAVLVALLVSRPRTVLRWIKRGFFAWQTLQKLGSVIAVRLPGSRWL